MYAGLMMLAADVADLSRFQKNLGGFRGFRLLAGPDRETCVVCLWVGVKAKEDREGENDKRGQE